MYGATSNPVSFAPFENSSDPLFASGVFQVEAISGTGRCIGRASHSGERRLISQIEKQRRSSQRKGEDRTMNRHSYQQGHIEEVKTRHGLGFKIKWRIRTREGEWRWQSETLYGPTKKQAKGILAGKIRESSAVKPETTDLLFREFVETDWKSYLNRKHVKPSTQKGYECVLGKHILPVLGDLRIREVQPLDIEKLVQSKTAAGLAPRTTRNMLVVLQSIFSMALDNDVIDRSPVRKKHKPEVPRKSKPAWGPVDVRKIVDEVSVEHRALFTVASLTALRIGEILALQWKHVDFEACKLTIVQSLWEGQLVSPKTEASVRAILFGRHLEEVLTRHLEASKHIGAGDFVFCKDDGSPLNADVLRRDVLYPAIERLRLPRESRSSGFHAFRHSAASLINARTGNLKLAQKLLGHSEISTTADVYTHTSDESEREASETLEREIFGDLFPVVPNSGTGTKVLVGNRNGQMGQSQ